MNIYSEPLGIRNIPNFITAESPQGLRRKMLRNNIKWKGYVKYFNIQFVKGKWVAWYVIGLEESALQESEDINAAN